MKDIIVIGIICILFIILIILSYHNREDIDDNIIESNDWKEYKDKDEEIFSHPVTGYRGNRVNMDAYIQNREKELTNKL